MAILEKVGATETPAYTAVLNNLGLVYMDKQDLARAEEHYQKALAVAERLQGTESHHISLYLQNLGSRRPRPQGVCEGVRVHDARTGDSPAQSSAPNTSTSLHS